ncbi:MAG: hypothetical protein CMO55_22880 [Verrucomicrobiales bacterium]|nr:hypothetical protein [Verrucomicrobiales bacterium]
MLFSPFLATRYLKPKRTFVSIITVISITGVALGVWLLAVVIAVFTGYGERIKESILGFEPHLVVNSGGFIDDFVPIYQDLEAMEGITSVTPFVQGQVLMHFSDLQSAPTIRGILQPEGEELERMTAKIARDENPEFPGDPDKMILRGKFDVSDPYSAVVGDGLANAQGIEVGDTLIFHSPNDVKAIMDAIDEAEESGDEGERKSILEDIREMTLPQEVVVKGIFDSGHFDFDSNIVFVNLETAQVLYKCDLEQCHGIAMRTEDAFKVDVYKEKVKQILPEHYSVLTWSQMHKLIFDAVAAERQAMYLILFMIMIVGGFCIMNTMITVTFQKKSEIGLLKALGCTEWQVAGVFLCQGILVGIMGVIVGLAVAQITIEKRNDLALWIGQHFNVDIFSSEIYKVDGGLPAKQTPRDFIIISTGAFVACTLASLIPALIAASLQPAKALRSE